MRAYSRIVLFILLGLALLASTNESRTVVVPGKAAWTDTGMDVVQGQEISFEAAGQISLQKGNPQAGCGPDGYDLRIIQQPIPERNMGALIGKVVIAVTVIKDPDTGKERTDEAAELFYIGAAGLVTMPAKGRLFLGINELVVGDNAGEFTVTVVTGGEGDPAHF